jgi:outer membrane receptor protein involved in Fe transport
MRISFPLSFTALGALSVCVAATAHAANEPGLVIEEVTVTARKFEESLQDAPVSVSAFTASALEAAGLKSISDISNYTPGLYFQKDQGRRFDRPVLRGMSNILGVNNVANFIDGAYVGGSIQSTEIQNLERVEVIKGPQAALFGRSTFAGAINYISRQPSNEFNGKIDSTIASHDEYEVGGFVSGPLIADTLLFYAAARYYDKGGEWKNYDGRSIGGEQSQGASLALTFNATEALRIKARMTYDKSDDEAPPNALQTRFLNNCFVTTPPTSNTPAFCGELVGGPLELDLDRLTDPGVNAETQRANLQFDWDLQGWTLAGVVGYSDYEEERQFDADFQRFLGGAPAGQTHRKDEGLSEEYSYELRLSSPQENRFRGLVGVFYLDATQGAGIDDPFTWRRSYPIEQNFQAALRTPQVPGYRYVDNLAWFGSVAYDLTDQLTMTGELRVATDEIKQVSLTRTQTAEYDATLPRFIVDYKLNEDLLLYGIAAKGNKPGGFNGNVNLPLDLQSYDEESAWNYELGAKSTLLDGRALFNVAAYFIDWEGQQLTNNFQPPVGTPLSFITNVGDVETFGIEFDTKIKLTENLSIDALYSYVLTEYVGGGTPEVTALNGRPQSTNIVGNEVPRSPRHQFGASVNWRQPVSDQLEFVARVDANYRSKSFVQVDNLQWVGDRTLANARLGLESDRWTLTAWVENLFDDDTLVGGTRYVDFKNDNVPGPGFPRGYLVTLAPGRQYGLTATYRFGAGN